MLKSNLFFSFLHLPLETETGVNNVLLHLSRILIFCQPVATNMEFTSETSSISSRETGNSMIKLISLHYSIFISSSRPNIEKERKTKEIKFLDLAKELSDLWIMKITVIATVIFAAGEKKKLWEKTQGIGNQE